jgi:peptidoglycan/xylan/chitin deacetylase (PgdA/CDA1 family)
MKASLPSTELVYVHDQAKTTPTAQFRQDSVGEAGGIHRGPASKRQVALTFDACPSSSRGGYDEKIVQTLLETRTPATFFLSGRWAQKHPEETGFLARQPDFAIGTHGFRHEQLSRRNDREIAADLATGKRVLERMTRRRIILFRPPYAEADRRIVRVADSLGLTTVLFDLASGDPDTAITARRLADYVSSCARSGSIVIMHVNGRGWHTAEALPEIIRRLRQRGFTLVTVPALLGIRASTPLKSQ